MGVTIIPAPSVEAGGDTIPVASASGIVQTGDAASLVIISLDDTGVFNVSEASLVLADGQPAPTNLNLLLVTYDGAGAITSQSTIISGDGSTQFVDETGDPLSSYTNSTGGTQLAGVVVDNGQVGAGTGANQDVHAEITYEKA